LSVPDSSSTRERVSELHERVFGTPVESADDTVVLSEKFWLGYERNLLKAEARLRAIWNKAKPLPHMDPDEWRADVCGTIIQFNQSSKRTKYGWHIDHKKPISLGGTDDLSNLQPQHWRNNLIKGAQWPWSPGTQRKRRPLLTHAVVFESQNGKIRTRERYYGAWQAEYRRLCQVIGWGEKPCMVEDTYFNFDMSEFLQVISESIKSKNILIGDAAAILDVTIEQLAEIYERIELDCPFTLQSRVKAR
jgi:hypothetical protein